MLNYQIALTCVAFDNSYKNVLRFSSRQDQEDYFNVNSLFSNAKNCNYAVNNLMNAVIYYDADANDNINELLSKNYCIVKDLHKNVPLKYYYYYIINATQESGNRIKLNLELDIFQTYYIDLTFGDCLINRAHLNRFKDAGAGDIVFNGDVDSKLFEKEPITNVAKRLTKRTKISLNTYFEDNTINKWLDDNVIAWMYAFMDPTHIYQFAFDLTKVIDISNPTGDYQSDFSPNVGTLIYPRETEGQTTARLSATDSEVMAICIPIYKSNNYLYISQNFSGKENKLIRITNDALAYFLKYNGGGSFVYGLKISNVPPFSDRIGASYHDIQYQIDDNGNLILRDAVQIPGIDSDWYALFENTTAYITAYDSVYRGILAVDTQKPIIKAKPYTIDKEIKFVKSHLIGVKKDPKFNPKLLAQEYYEVNLTDETEEGFSYDIQKLNNNILNIGYMEPLVPYTTKNYITLLDTEGVYISDTSKNLTGRVGSNDLSLIYTTSQYQSMIANNKNFAEIASTNFGIDFAKSAMNSVLNPLNVTGVLDVGKNMINFALTTDNMRNAPSALSNAKGNAYFNLLTTSIGIFVEEYDILDNEKNIINDYMDLYGFTFNNLGNIKDFDNIRKYHNFVQAQIETISCENINISEIVHQKFRQCFANGVRFWNTDNFNYDLENYENWLEEGA